MKEEGLLPETPYQEIVAEIWGKVLKHKQFGLEDDFFDVGGTSLGAIKVISELSQHFELDIDDVFAAMTVRHIAGCLRENQEAMKQNLKDILQFKELKEVSAGELEEYRSAYAGQNQVKPDFDKYRRVLLLGGTGFLGIYLLNQLLVQTAAVIVVLVRGQSDAAERLRKQYEYYFGGGSYEQYEDRIEIVNGDLTKKYMGISADLYGTLAQSMDAVVNSAALVKHMGKNDDFASINVKTVETVLAFASTGCKKAVHHMSTIGIAYGEQGENAKTLFTEYDELVAHPLNNQYLSSKYQAEQRLISARRGGIESTIYRMSGILFDSQTGRYQQNMEQSTAYIFYRALYKLGIIPGDIKRPMDISNVDMVSKAIVRLMFSNQDINQIYHVINPNPLPIGEILKLMRGKQWDASLKEMSVDEIFSYYQQTDPSKREHFYELAFHCEIISWIGKNQYNICMEKTINALEQLGMAWNTPDAAMVERACEQAKKEGFC
ncbi:SDR family oxidoreductase [Lacrimispora brassicae]